MNNMDKARLIVERLNEKGADLGNAAWGIVEQALDEIDATNDPYMPTNEEWAEYPLADTAATDDYGEVWLYRTTLPVAFEGMWNSAEGNVVCYLKDVTPPADYRNTLRRRPEGI